MKWTSLATLGLVAAANAAPTSDSDGGNLIPDGGAPEGCKADYNGRFEVSVSRVGKRSIEARGGCDNPNALLLTLSGGVLKDAKNRTGYIASNYQFQFDAPPQVDSIYTAGFSVCGNSSLALGPSTTWYQCLSGDFYNLYDRNWAAQCEPIDIMVMPCGGSQTAQSTVAPLPMCQIGDGQIQVHSTPCGSGAAQPTAAPITQISDGQPQAPPSQPADPVVTQISDGQPQAPPSQPSDPIITQISDGQAQAPTTPTELSIMPSGLPQAPSGLPLQLATSSQPSAPTGTRTLAERPPASTGTGITLPASAVPTTVTVNGGSKGLPSAGAALAVALLGIIAV